MLMEIKSTKPKTLSEAKEIMEGREKDGELGYEQSQALEHAQKFCKSDSKKIEKLLEKLKKNDKISEELALKIIDIAPSTPATLKAILAKDKIEMSEEELNDIVKEFA